MITIVVAAPTMARKQPTKEKNNANIPRWDDRFIDILKRDYITQNVSIFDVKEPFTGTIWPSFLSHPRGGIL
jgi:hypothetical protein